MGLLKRVKSVLESFGNACVDRLEEPRRMLDQYLLEAERELGKIDQQATTVLADEEAVKRRYKECENKIKDCERYALQASRDNQEEAALRFLETRDQTRILLEQLGEEKVVAIENSKKVLELKSRAEVQLESLRARKEVLSSQIALNEARLSMAKAQNGDTGNLNIKDFERLSDKIQRMSDVTTAQERLQESSAAYSFDRLIEQYGKAEKQAKLKQELEELKTKNIMEHAS